MNVRLITPTSKLCDRPHISRSQMEWNNLLEDNPVSERHVSVLLLKENKYLITS